MKQTNYPQPKDILIKCKGCGFQCLTYLAMSYHLNNTHELFITKLPDVKKHIK